MRRLRQTARAESGMSLIELLVAMSIGIVVIAGGAKMLVAAVKSQPRAASHATAVQTAQTAMDRMTRELRQGSSVVTATASQLAMITYVDAGTCGGAASSTAISCRVTYACASGTCTRTVSQPNGSSPGTPTTVVKGLSSSNVFSYVPNTGGSSNCAATGSGTLSYVCVNLVFNGSDGRNAITLSDGVALRTS
jgi:prepilin-type N-terminal cleavage/methylation domain-containing protein